MLNKLVLSSLFETTRPSMTICIQDFSEILRTELRKHLEPGSAISGSIKFPCRTVTTGYGPAERDEHLCDKAQVSLCFSPKANKAYQVSTTLDLTAEKVASYVKDYFAESLVGELAVDLKVEFVVENTADDRFGGRGNYEVTKVTISTGA